MRVSTQWTKGLSDDTRKTFVEGLVANPYLKLLRKILEVKLEATRRESYNKEDYSGNWVPKRANRDGREAELQSVIDLLTFEDRNDRSIQN